MDEHAPAIRVDRLTKRYGRTLAVDGLSFEVHPGHVTGFLGPDGAGKSTMMRLILGLDAPTAGTVTVGGVRSPTSQQRSPHPPAPRPVDRLRDPLRVRRHRARCRRRHADVSRQPLRSMAIA